MKTIQITNGPSREELFDGLRLFAEKRLVPFCMKMQEEEKYVAVAISSIEAEDGSGHSWNLKVTVNQYFITESFFSSKKREVEKGVAAVKVCFETFKNMVEENYLVSDFRKETVTINAYYSTKTRKGTIVI